MSAKKSLASSAAFRMYSYADPWNLLVPLRVRTLTAAPATLPSLRWIAVCDDAEFLNRVDRGAYDNDISDTGIVIHAIEQIIERESDCPFAETSDAWRRSSGRLPLETPLAGP